jgi:hypothetical protein
LSENDFLSFQEMGRRVASSKECEAAGLSVFQDQLDAIHYREKYPRLGERIAHGFLAPEHGKLQPTPRGGNSHATWWPYEGVESDNRHHRERRYSQCGTGFSYLWFFRG